MHYVRGQPSARTTNNGYFGIGNPVGRAAGLSGMNGLGDVNIAADGTITAAQDTSQNGLVSALTNPQLITGMNSEILFGANLYRGLTGQAPLQASQYAPQVAVGLNQDTSNLLLLGGAAVLAVMLMKGGKRKKKK